MEDIFGTIIFGIYALFLVVCTIVLIYLAYKRITAGKEDFEDRNN